MDVTWDNLLARIEEDPIRQLGGFSPVLLHSYFAGYEHARIFHSMEPIGGEVSFYQFNQWFMDNIYAGPQGYASYCELCTDSEEEALQLFFEFRKLAHENAEVLEKGSWEPLTSEISFLELLQLDAIRTRPAVYFGNRHWLTGLWAMWKGYIQAEVDAGIIETPEMNAFDAFEKWLWERYRFGEERNWGRLFEFLALGVNANALENFFDHFDLFLSGGSPKDHTVRFRAFLDEAVASAKKEQERLRGT